MLLGVPAELPGRPAALEVVFGSLEELRDVSKRLLVPLWTTFGPSFWAEGDAGMDSDALRLLYLRQHYHVSVPDTKMSYRHRVGYAAASAKAGISCQVSALTWQRAPSAAWSWMAGWHG